MGISRAKYLAEGALTRPPMRTKRKGLLNSYFDSAQRSHGSVARLYTFSSHIYVLEEGIFMQFLTIRRAVKAAFPHTLPVLTGFLCLGVAYGMLMASKGYGPLWSGLMSAIAFCGSMQYAAVTLLTVAFDPFQALLMSLLVNARHLFYGLSLLQTYRGMGKARIPLIYTLCDETFSIVCSVEPPPGVPAKHFYLAVSLLNHFYWVGATVLGGILGSLLQIQTGGLDFVLTALFVVLFLEKWRSPENRPSAVIGVGCALLCLVIFGSNQFMIPAMGVILLCLLGGRKRLCR